MVPIPFLPSVKDAEIRSVYDCDASRWIPKLRRLGGVRSLVITLFNVHADDGDHPSHIAFHVPLFYPENSPANEFLRRVSGGLIKWRGNVILMCADGTDIVSCLNATPPEDLLVAVIRYFPSILSWNAGVILFCRELTRRFFTPSRRSFFLAPGRGVLHENERP